MHISSQILRLALLRIFTEAGVSAGTSLSITQLSARWPETGLRTADLRDAVRELMDSGDLIGAGRSETLTLSLSPQGLRGLREPFGEMQTASFEEEATLFMAKHRGRGGSAPSQERRAVVAASQVAA